MRLVVGRAASSLSHARTRVRAAAALLLGSWLDDDGAFPGAHLSGSLPVAPAPTATSLRSLPAAFIAERRLRGRNLRPHASIVVVALAAVVAASPLAVKGAPGQAPGASAGQASRPAGAPVVAARDGEGMHDAAQGSAGSADAPDVPVVVSGPVAVSGRAGSAFDGLGSLDKPLNVRGKVPKAPHPVRKYRVQPGDAISVLAERFSVRPMTLWWANHLRDFDTINVGMLLRVPPTSGTIHVVSDGDTLGYIARIYRADADKIAAYNQLRGGVVLLGQRLTIPGGRGAAYEAFPVEPDLPPPVPGLQREEMFVPQAPANVAVAPPPFDPSADEEKATGGVGWPSDPNASAFAGDWTWEILDQGTYFVPPKTEGGHGGQKPKPDGGNGGGSGPHDDGSPEPGPPQGTVLDIHDKRLTLTGAQVLADRSFRWPIKGYNYMTQDFHSEHLGIDIGAALGTKVVAVASGRVMFRGWRDDRSGYSVWLKHGPHLFTIYIHLSAIDVQLGQWVDKGQVVGRVGSTGNSTGPHLHFSVNVGGDRPDVAETRMDPLLFFQPR